MHQWLTARFRELLSVATTEGRRIYSLQRPAAFVNGPTSQFEIPSSSLKRTLSFVPPSISITVLSEPPRLKLRFIGAVCSPVNERSSTLCVVRQAGQRTQPNPYRGSLPCKSHDHKTRWMPSWDYRGICEAMQKVKARCRWRRKLGAADSGERAGRGRG